MEQAQVFILFTLQRKNGFDNITTEVIDATDLSAFTSASFDVVLCLGPLYHLKAIPDQKKCISECLRVLKPNGILAIAYINKFFILPYLVKDNPRFLNDHWMTKILEEGSISSADEDSFWRGAYFHSPEEVDDLLKDHEVYKLENVATDGVGMFMRDTLNRLDGDEFNQWIEYHLKTCAEPSILGLSNHGMYVCRKNPS